MPFSTRECSRYYKNLAAILLCWVTLHSLTSRYSHQMQFSYMNPDLNLAPPDGPMSTAQTERNAAFLVILIITRPAAVFRRNRIRETWLRHADTAGQANFVKHFFVVGSEGLDAALTAKLRQEPDLLLLPIKDTYRRLTMKVLAAFTVLDHGFTFKYLLKVDDDAFVRVQEVVHDLEVNQPRVKHYQGFFYGASHVIRDNPNSKWYEPDYPLCDRYLPYALGTGYILSSDLVHYLAYNSDNLKLFHNEDVSVGTWLAPLQVNR